MLDAIRLQKYLAERGIASRRASEELIRAGAVRVNGVIATIGQSVFPGKDIVLVHGKKIAEKAERKAYFALNKPRGFVTTMEDPHAVHTVAQLLAEHDERLFPVGRLDKDSEGLLLCTNDGDFAQMLTHPSHHVKKTYHVSIKGNVDESQLDQLRNGMPLDGKPTLPADVRILQQQENRTVFEITLREGRNRQIRRMCEQLGLQIVRLQRTAIGSLKLGTLPLGKLRELTEKEITAIMEK
jgi:23S rRNA pseudouridine2605 synthase